MDVWRRPLFLIFITLLAFVSVWYHWVGDGGRQLPGQKLPGQKLPGQELPGQELPRQEPPVQQPAECVGKVEEIQVKASARVLVLADVHVKNTNSNERIPCEKILIFHSKNQHLFDDSRPGNQLDIRGTYAAFTRAGNPGEFDERLYYQSRGIDGKMFAESVTVTDRRCDRLRNALFMLRQQAAEHLFAAMREDDAGMLCAMLLGEKAYLPEEEKEMYQRTGIGHMLVISGLHISLLAAGLFYFLRSYVMPMKGAVIVTIAFLFLYGQFTGFQVAAVRAVLMVSCSLFARYAGRSYDPLSALSLSGIVTIALEPAQLFQCGFLLSYTAIGGVLLFAPVMEKSRNRSKLWQSVFFSASVFAVTMPVMLWFYYEICPYSVLANVLVLPFLSLLVGIGAAGCIVSFFWPPGGAFLLTSAHYILEFYEFVCRVILSLPFSRVVTGRPPVWCLVAYYVVLVLAVRLYLKWDERRWFYAGAALLFLLCLSFRPRMVFLYTQLDVGQGDCACLFYGDTTILIDGGSSSEKEIGNYTIQKFLKYYGRTRIDFVFLSHSDADHTNGVEELAANQDKWGIEVGGVVMPEIGKKDERYESLVSLFSKWKTPVYTMEKGERFCLGELSLECLHPFPDYEWKSENDYSLTLDISYRNIRILSMGDLEEEGEQTLERVKGPYDLLKVGHHGSKTSSSPGFLHEAAPRHAVISAGRDNRYGHPAPVTIEKLEQEGACIWSTMEQGAVFLRWSEAGGKISGYLQQ